MAKVGFVGLGKMGAAMAPRLLDVGHSLTVWNRSAPSAQALGTAGARVATRPAEVTDASDFVVSMLSDDAAASAVFNGPDGLLSVSSTGKLFIEMSTLKPSTVRDLAAQAGVQGGALVDAPVSGTVAPAKTGQLLAFCGGSDEDVSRARPILDVLTRRVIHAGPVGQGALLKLVVNLPLAVYWDSLAEAMALGSGGGLSPNLMIDAIEDSSAALKVLPLKSPIILGKAQPVAFDAQSMQKDLRTMLDTAEKLGVELPTTTATLGAYSNMVDAGFGSADAVTLVQFLAEQVPTEE
jgi:3-hydroxyisobutyrate dehydrogenase